jgi:uncharacterized protein (DUF58 family)
MVLQRSLPVLIVLFLTGAMLRMPWLVIFSGAILLFLLIALVLRRFALIDVNYHRHWHYRRGFPGEETNLQIEIENRKLLPLTWLRVSDQWPLSAAPIDRQTLSPSNLVDQGQLVNALSLKPREKVTRSYPIRFRKRGVYTVGPVDLETSDLFGLFPVDKRFAYPETLTVFPTILPLSALHLPADDPFGDRSAQRRLFEDPTQPMGVRPYQPDDDFRRVHWPATARTGSVQIKVYQPVTSHVLTVCLNVTTADRAWLGTNQDLLEGLINVAASTCYHAFYRGYAVGLVSNGCLSHADHPFQIAPGRSTNQLAALLESLSAVTAYTNASFETFLIKSLPKIPYGSTLLLVTAVMPDLLIDTLMRLKKYRPHTSLISLAETPPPTLPGIQTIHLPFSQELLSNDH